jgi:hypothetical protein
MHTNNNDLDNIIGEEPTPERRAELEAVCADIERHYPLSLDMRLLWVEIHSMPVDDLAHFRDHLDDVIHECDSEVVAVLARRLCDILDAEIDRRVQTRQRLH